MASVRSIVLAGAALSLVAPAAHAQEAGVGGSVSVGSGATKAEGDAAAAAPAPAPARTDADGQAAVKPIRRFRPERNMIELGVFGGLFVANKSHDFYAPITTPGEPIKRPSADLGVRAAFFPLSFLGVEAEFAAIPAKYQAGLDPTAAPGGRGFLWGVRGHAILQLPMFRVVPFLLGGYGAMGVSSAANVAGKDVDPVGHFGGGVKYFFNKWIGLRLDFRGLIAAQAMERVGAAPHFETTLGLVITLNRKKPPPDPDRDRDGFRNDVDKCPDQPGIAPDGCPDRDSDGDSFMDSVDACKDVPGVAPDGCPPGDRDKDSFTDDVDKCPDEPGVAPDGCPPGDRDKDGITDDIDKCPDDPETANGYEDSDGCPDEVPKQVKQFTGVMQGIQFDLDKDTIKKSSTTTLDAAAKIFQEYPDLKVEIVGHADETGTREHNVDLSQRRADAVKAYLVKKGVAADRIQTRGAGPDEPIDTSGTEAGRAKNRRIEFKLK
ncbi:MAG: OmpA family protein [Myxococcales bacterium]|nr:OmpA family protein [Myxococcales bacterium]